MKILVNVRARGVRGTIEAARAASTAIREGASIKGAEGKARIRWSKRGVSSSHSRIECPVANHPPKGVLNKA